MSCHSKFANNINKLRYRLHKLNELSIAMLFTECAQIIYNLNRNYYNKCIKGNPVIICSVKKQHNGFDKNIGYFNYYYLLLLEYFYYYNEYREDIQYYADDLFKNMNHMNITEGMTIISNFAEMININGHYLINYLKEGSILNFRMVISSKDEIFIYKQFIHLIGYFITMHNNYIKFPPSEIVNRYCYFIFSTKIKTSRINIKQFIKYMDCLFSLNLFFDTKLVNYMSSFSISDIIDYLYISYIESNVLYHSKGTDTYSYSYNVLFPEENRFFTMVKNKSYLKDL